MEIAETKHRIWYFNTRRRRVLLLLIPVLALLLFAAFYNGLTVTRYTVNSVKLDSAIRIVLLTDLHSCSYGEAQHVLIDRINRQNPDLILMSGDIMDYTAPDTGAIELLEGIASEYPCYYVTGNHEFISGRVNEQKDIIRSYGVVVLVGNRADISVGGQEISIFGIDDPNVGQIVFDKQLESVSGLIEPAMFTILLSHRPELFELYIEYDVDLVLTGHAHGGQWRLPLIMSNGLLAPEQGLFPKYTNGIHGRNGTIMIVSRGLSKTTMGIPRIFNAPELVVVDLQPMPER